MVQAIRLANGAKDRRSTEPETFLASVRISCELPTGPRIRSSETGARSASWKWPIAGRSRIGSGCHSPVDARFPPRIFPRRAGRCLVATATRSRSKSRNNHVRKQVHRVRSDESDFSQVVPFPTQIARESEPLEGRCGGRKPRKPGRAAIPRRRTPVAVSHSPSDGSFHAWAEQELSGRAR